MTDYVYVAKTPSNSTLTGAISLKGTVTSTEGETLTGNVNLIGVACGQALGTVQIYGANTPTTSPILTAGDGAENSVNVNDGGGSGGGDGAAAQTWTDF